MYSSSRLWVPKIYICTVFVSPLSVFLRMLSRISTTGGYLCLWNLMDPETLMICKKGAWVSGNLCHHEYTYIETMACWLQRFILNSWVPSVEAITVSVGGCKMRDWVQAWVGVCIYFCWPLHSISFHSSWMVFLVNTYVCATSIPLSVNTTKTCNWKQREFQEV